MTMIAGGLNLDTMLALQPGAATGQGAASDTGFTDILAALEADVTPAAPVDGVTIAPMDAAAAVAPTINGVPDAPAEEFEDQEDTPEAGQPSAIAVTPPFVAPPIAITVASPIVVQPGIAPQQGSANAVAVRAAITPAATAVPAPADADAATAMGDRMAAMVIAAALPGKAPEVAASRPCTQPETGSPRVAALIGSTAAKLAQILTEGVASAASARVPVAAMPVSDNAAPAADPFQPAPAPASTPVLPPLPVVAATPEAMPVIDVAGSDTARQLAEQAVTARLDVANEAQLIDRLARDIAQLSGAEGRLKFQLNPEHLGSLHVEVEQRAEGVSLRFGTETEGARQVIADAQHRLVSEARAQGMRIAETHVDLGNHNQQGGSRGREAQPQPVVITHGEVRESVAKVAPDRPGARDRFA